jgi:hypothetical protein
MTRCQIQYSSITAAMIIPESLRMATLFPDCAMRPRRLAEPFRVVLKEENVSDWGF